MARRTVLVLIVAVIALVGFLGLSSAATASAAGASGPASASSPAPPTAAAATHSTPAPTVSASAVAPSLAERDAFEKSVLSKSAASGIPDRDIYLPNFNGGGRMDGDVVAPITTVAPAPMGLGDIGVINTTGTPTPTVLNSQSWEGSLTLNSADFFYLDNDGPDTFGVQLNTVLTNVTVWGNSHNDFWTQDVFFFTPSIEQVFFIDNIWNFSSVNQAEPASTFLSYGGVPTGSYYYDEDLTPITIAFPLTLHLYLNTSLANVSTTSGTMEVTVLTFGYDLVGAHGVQVSSGTYDTVEFDSDVAPSASVPSPHFQVNGGALTPTGYLLYDSELMIGGPGGGSTTQVYQMNGTMSLQYLDATTGQYVNAPSAWDAGTDTGESVQGISESYNTAGTVNLDAGPSLVLPLWNATPGGNQGTLTATGAISPDNAFVFVSAGTQLNNNTAAWAPILPGGTYRFTLPPGEYQGIALLTDHDARSLTWLGGAGTVDSLNIALTLDLDVGVDTPLFAWNNDQLANLSLSGSGTESSPYELPNYQPYPFLPYFGEMNDFLFPVFPGVLISGTTDYWVLEDPPSLSVVLPPGLSEELGAGGLPDTNQLQIEIYGDSHGTVIGGSDIGGWFYDDQFNVFPTPYYPDGEIVLWDDTSTLIADNVFEDQGVGIVLMTGGGSITGGGNTVFGNEFLTGTEPEIGFPAQFGIWEFEAGDLIYNNVFDTLIGAYQPDYNLWDGLQTPNENNSWNLPGWQTASTVDVVNGFDLSGGPIGSAVVCGNWWWDYAPGDALPYEDLYPVTTSQGEVNYPFIASGGDYCPFGPDGAVGYHVTFYQSGLTYGTWTLTVAGVTATAPVGDGIQYALPNGTWDYSVTAESGYVATPASGYVTIAGSSISGPLINFTGSGGVRIVEYLATIHEVGLPSGTTWSFSWGTSTVSTNASSYSFEEPNGTYTYGLNPVFGYQRVTDGGSLTIAGAAVESYAVFTPYAGYLNATVSPSTASVWVNGTSIPLTFGGFSIALLPGTYSVEVTASGYEPYFNNVSVVPVRGSSYAISLVAISSTTSTTGSGSSSSSGLTGTQFDELLIGLAVVAVAIVVAALLVRRRGGGATPTYVAEPAAPAYAAPAVAAAPPKPALPEYSEDNLPPSAGN